MTVVIPTYNRAGFIAEALQSCVDQGIPIEIIVVDDGSTDDTSDVVQNFGHTVTYIRQQNRREGAARNAGIARASAPLVAFLDSDDAFLPGKLLRDLEAFARRPDAGLIFSRATFVNEHGRTLHVAPTRPPVEQGVLGLVRHNYVPLSTAAVPLAVLHEVGAFSEEPSISGSYDWHLWVRIAARHPIIFVPERGAKIRSHSGNMMTDPRRMEGAIMAAAASYASDPTVRPILELAKVDVRAWVELHRALLWAFAGSRRRPLARLTAAISRDRAVLTDVRTWKILLRVALGRHGWEGLRSMRRPRPVR